MQCPGSGHYARTFLGLQIYQAPESYLDTEEFLLADSAYPHSKRLVYLFTECCPHGSCIGQANKEFDNALAHMCNRIERTIGILKHVFLV
jgi:hypothetical protein